MEVKVKKCELNFKNTREKIVMELTFQKTNEAVDIRDFLCKAIEENPGLQIEFCKGEYRVIDKSPTASTNACSILERLPAILQTFRTFNGQAEGEVPDTNSEPNDMAIKRDTNKGNNGDKGHGSIDMETQRNEDKGNISKGYGSNDMETQRNEDKGNVKDEDHGSKTRKGDKTIPKSSEKQNYGNKDHASVTDSEISEKTKETKRDIEAANQENTGNCAYTPQCSDSRDADESYSIVEARRQEDSRGFNAPPGDKMKMTSLPYHGSDIPQTAIGSSSHDSRPKAQDGMTGEQVQSEENTSSLGSVGAKMETDESKSSMEGKISKQGPSSSFSEAQQGDGKAEDISKAVDKLDENISVHTSGSGDNPVNGRTVLKKTDEIMGITNLSHSEAQKIKETAEKSGDIKATDKSVPADISEEHGQGSISGASQAKDGNAPNAKDMKQTKYVDPRLEAKLSLPGTNSDETLLRM